MTSEPGLPGYLNPDYAASLGEFGEPRRLERSGGTILCRAIAGTSFTDAIHPYPLLFCRDWTGLRADLERTGDLISLVAVADPLGGASRTDLAAAFPDVCRPFKEHFVVEVELAEPSAHHRARSRRAARSVETRVVDRPGPLLDEWTRLYAGLCARRGVTGLRAFSRSAFQVQLGLPGSVAVAGFVAGRCVAVTLWYLMGNLAYYHLGAADDEGYRHSASHLLFETAIRCFRERGVKFIDLGAGAGLSDIDDGLTRFKRGWATTTRTAYLCGRIFQRDPYEMLSAGRGEGSSEYFPSYRSGEFA